MNRTFPIIVLIGVVAVASASGIYYYYQNVASASNLPSLCHDPASISSHVYNPFRLNIVKSCITVSGIIASVDPRNDGDYRVRLVLNPQYSNLTTDANGASEYGDLVLNIVCAAQPISQPNAVLACNGYTNNITIPSINDNITVTGPYALDTTLNNLAEIHPVYSLMILPQKTTTY